MTTGSAWALEVFSTVAADALVQEHPAIRTHSANQVEVIIVLDWYRNDILHL